jgi:UDP-4-amino-4,6-dideoxy-N-acetyl-beta-L-altrosamine N-acetyltransferase
VIEMRDVRPNDAELLLGWRNLPEVRAYMYSDHVIGEEEHRAWFARAMEDEARRYWIIMLDGEDVGLANVYDIDRRHSRAVWAFYLASANVRGRGVGSVVEYRVLAHVFDEMGLNRLLCEVLASNPAVVGMHERFGFTQEGVLREHICKEDGPVDVVVLGMLRAEWKANRVAIEQRLSAKGLL